MQVGVSTLAGGSHRLVHRGGGADVRDHLAEVHANENCSELCYMGTMFGGMGQNWYDLPVYSGYYDVHYLKCMEAAVAVPLNGLRIQHASQIYTLNIDPTVPQMNLTDMKACLRMKVLEFPYEINTFILFISSTFKRRPTRV